MMKKQTASDKDCIPLAEKNVNARKTPWWNRLKWITHQILHLQGACLRCLGYSLSFTPICKNMRIAWYFHWHCCLLLKLFQGVKTSCYHFLLSFRLCAKLMNYFRDYCSWFSSDSRLRMSIQKKEQQLKWILIAKFHQILQIYSLKL